MPSKKSKSRSPLPSLWKAEPRCSERALEALARELALELRAGDRVLLEGPMGAGKSTFARFLLEGLRALRPPEGSPTFPLVHVYPSPLVGEVAHLDLYRLRSEEEIEEAGLLEYLWWPEGVALVEWLSNWPDLEARLREDTRTGKVFRVELGFLNGADELRDVKIERVSASLRS